MTEPSKKLQRDCSSDHHFLFCKKDTQKRESAAQPPPPDLTDLLSREYPGMATGTAFLEKAMHHVAEMDGFISLVIRIDRESAKEDIFLDAAARVARVVHGACDENGGLWGWLGSDLFGAVFPAKGDDGGTGYADAIIRMARESDAGSVTIGIASFPTIDFPKNTILDNARKALDHATFFGPGSRVRFDAVSMNISGDQLYQAGDLTGAVAEFNKALELDPLNVNVHNSLGVCYGVLMEYEKAAASFARATDLDPDEAMAVYNQGLIHLTGEENGEAALKCFLDAEKIDGEIYEVQLQIGKLYLDREEPENGLIHLEKAARLSPTAGIVQRYIGDGHRVLGDRTAALHAYKKAVKLNPNDPDALSALGFLMGEVGENPEISVTFCRHSVEIAPDNGLFRHRLGRLYLNQEKMEAALAEFRAASELGHPSTDEIEKITARIEREMGDEKKFSALS